MPAFLAFVEERFGGHDLLVFDERRLTYREVIERSARLACQLIEAGIGKGSRVGLLFPNSPEFLIAFFAVTRIGAVAVPISTLSAGAEILRIARHADLALLMT
jgi:acyl-CoA synthetase (AMP-forming)/AMP-acid ligase II